MLKQDRHVNHASTGILCLGLRLSDSIQASKSVTSHGAVCIKVLDRTPVATYLINEVRDVATVTLFPALSKDGRICLVK